MSEQPRLLNRMSRIKWLKRRQTVTSKRKQQGTRTARTRKNPLTAFSGLSKLARLMRQGRLPDARAGIIIRAQENAAKRAAR